MQELIDQASVETPSAAPAPEEIAAREQQRAALRDLVELSTSSAATEAEIDQRLAKTIAEADDQVKKAVREINERHALLKQEAAEQVEKRRAEVKEKLEADLSAVHQWDRAARQRIRNETEPAERDIKSKFDHAVWMAESVFEVAATTAKQEYKKVNDAVEEQKTALTEMEARAWHLLGTHRLALPEDNDSYAQPLSADPRADVEAQQALVARHLSSLKRLRLPSIFAGASLYITATVLGAGVAAVTQLILFGSLFPPNWAVVAAAFAVTFALVVGIVALLRASAKSHVLPLRQAFSTASRAAEAQLATAAAIQEKRQAEAVEARRAEVLKAREKFKPIMAEANRRRDAALQAVQNEFNKRLAAFEQGRAKTNKAFDEWAQKTVGDVENKHQEELRATKQRAADIKAAAQKQYEEARVALEARLNHGLGAIQSPVSEALEAADGHTILSWDDPGWATWTPPKKFAANVRIGELDVDLKRIADNAAGGKSVRLALPEPFTVPVTLGFPTQASLLVQADRDGRPEALKALQMAMARLLTSQPAGRVRFTIIDPVGLGQNFAGFMHLADHDEALVGGRIWTEAEQIEQKLTQLTEHMETVIQKYLRNEYETIDEYNAQAGELAEPYRFLVIADFPVAFQGNAYRRLASIAATGARCGVYTLISRDTRHPLPGGTHLDELEANCINIVQKGDRFIWKDKVLSQFPLTLDPPPTEEQLTGILDIVGKRAKEAKRVEVAFSTIAPDQKDYWTRSSTEDLVVPVGKQGATRLQQLRIGKGVAQHGLIAGKTGSGKSTLLHAIITNIAMWYSPDEVEVYLIDFKKGVEFKTYAQHRLPHARAIAVESDREFGLSVLQRLDAELIRRGEIFRRAAVQDLGAYRKTANPEKMPRTLLLIDEFQEFFSEDDKLSQEASLLLDRLVRQGRAFGIHLLLGSQTIGGTSGLARSTIGQMGIRIALQTSEADSHMILGDNNSAARLLTRPGEAIYNDAGGLVEGNSPFQVAWLPDAQRDIYLDQVTALAKQSPNGNGLPELVVFEGNAPADITVNKQLSEALEGAKRPKDPNMAPTIWLGDPVAIKDPTGIVMRRQSGTNALLVGQQDEAAMGILVASIVAIAAQNPPNGAKFYVLDGTPADSPLAAVMPAVKESIPQQTTLVEYRSVDAAFAEISEELKRRQAGEGGQEGIFIVIYGLQRYRALRKSEDSFGGFSMSTDDEPKAVPADKMFADLLKEGPPLGIHVIAWCDTAISVDRTLDRNSMREFDNRILFQMSANDSSTLIDSPAANKLGFNRALAFSEEQGVMEKFRPYGLPDKAWLGEAKKKLMKGK